MTELLYKEEVYQIIGAAMEVYNELKNGFLEAIYQEALETELNSRNIPFQSQQNIKIKYKGQYLRKEYVADLICYGKIIIELKAISYLTSIEEAQVINYLKATGIRLGLLINFGNHEKLEWKRLVL